MYSREEKLKAVELFIRYDKSPASVIREIGYPCRATLYAWHEEYLANGCDMPSVNNYRRYTEEQRSAAVDHFFRARPMPCPHDKSARVPFTGTVGSMDRRTRARPQAEAF